MEEYFRAQEPLITNIHSKGLLGNGIHPFKSLQPLWLVRIVFVEFFDYVRAHVAKFLLQISNARGEVNQLYEEEKQTEHDQGACRTNLDCFGSF